MKMLLKGIRKPGTTIPACMAMVTIVMFAMLQPCSISANRKEVWFGYVYKTDQPALVRPTVVLHHIHASSSLH